MAVNLNLLRGYLNQDEKMVNKFLNLFCLTIPEELQKLKEYLLNSDFEMVSITAHGIKTQCAYLGLDEAKNIAQQMENIAQVSENNFEWLNNLELHLNSEIIDLKMTFTKE